MIAATAGTTNAGMVDPLRDCAAIAQAHDVWLHVDAAWAGALIASPKFATVLSGMDSVTIDAHKWFATTMGCGMYLAARPESLADAFRVSASYMPSNDQAIDPYVNTAQWSRRFLGLRLFLSLASAGWAGYAAHVERGVALIETLARTMTEAGWTVANDSQAAVLCLRPPAGSAPPDDIVERVLATGKGWVSAAQLDAAT